MYCTIVLDTKSLITIHGKIIFKNLTEFLKDVDVFVSLEDVSRQDFPSQTIAIKKLSGIDIAPGNNSCINYVLEGAVKHKDRTYIVSAHVDVNKDGVINVGDHINTGSYIIDSYSKLNYVTIEVTKVI